MIMDGLGFSLVYFEDLALFFFFFFFFFFFAQIFGTKVYASAYG